ncbi:MAG: PAS domain S-box protein [Candidatus Kapabacteria bacterium]|nr:PAS domain S-box protein [Ignavibacteriota bacterium]MCW5883922.1 PAS domain S-box protein [Candidatus Kapabacteria bacterium]
MKKSKINIFDEIREKAEKLMTAKKSDPDDYKNYDLSKLLHDLEVYQIELELQHEELTNTRDNLQFSSDKYIELYDFAPIGYITLDENKKILRINQTGCQIFATDKPKATGKSITDYISKKSQDDFYIFYNDLLEKNLRQSVEIMIKNSNGSEFYCQMDGVRNKNTSSDEIISISITDISKQKNTELELFSEKNRLELIYRHVPVALITLDEKLRIKSWNPKAETIIGYTEEEVLRKYIYEVLKFNFEEKVLFEDIINKGKLQGLQIKTKFDEVLTINFKSDKLIDATNINSGYIITLEDITSETRTSESLQESERRFRSIIEKTPIGMCITDDEGLYEYVNPAYCKIYKYMPDELLGKHFTIVVNDEVRSFFKELHDRFIYEGEHVEIRGEWDVVDKYGDKISILADAARIIGIDNKPKKVTFVIDVSEMKKVEDNLRKAINIAEIANKSKSEFLANMSHEIRTPLNAILGFSELLKNKKFDSDKYEYYLDGISVAGVNLLNLINDILDLSKIEAGKMIIKTEPVDLSELCEEVIKIFIIKITEKNLKVETRISENTPLGLALDEIRLRQILFNLMGNAVKFTEKGSITIEVNFNKNNEISGDLQVNVVDSGIGIPESQIQRIFEPFMQTEGQNARKYGGTGLGLPITKRLVEMMNGSIEVESELGKGTRFSFIIKNVEISDSSVVKSKTKSENAIGITFNNQKVLVIDDNYDNIEIVKGFLKNSGLEILSISDAEKAINKAIETLPDIILLDMQLPKTDGFELSKLLSENPATKDIPIIAMTASSIESFPITTRLMITGYIRKPFTKNILIGEISRIIVPVENIIESEPFYLSFLKFKQNLVNIPETKVEKNSYLYLTKILMKEWDDVNNTLIIDKIKDFGKHIIEFSEKTNIHFFKEYSNYLISAIDNIDIESLIEILPLFEELVKKIKSI